MTKYDLLSEREIEKSFLNIKNVFNGRENEDNWEKRDASVKQLDNMLNSANVDEYKEVFVRGIHNEIVSLVKSIHSLRTSFAIAGLLLLSTISITLGGMLDHYTMEVILSNLIKCSVVTKKLISTKVSEVTNTFLSNTNFYPKMVAMLCKSMNEKNAQLRTFCCSYILTLLETHGSKESVQAAITNSESSLSLDSFLKKGLTDASLSVRDSCRSVYWKYKQYWPIKAKILFESLDIPTQKTLGKVSTSTKPLLKRSNSSNLSRLISPKLTRPKPEKISTVVTTPSVSSSSSSSSRSSSTTASSSTRSTATSIRSTAASIRSTTTSIRTRTSLTGSISTSTRSAPVSTRPLPTSSKLISNSPKLKSNSSKLTPTSPRLKSTSPKLTPTSPRLTSTSPKLTPTSTKSTTIPNHTNPFKKRVQSSHEKECIESATNLLNSLKSDSAQTKCKGIHLLAERLKIMPYTPTTKSTLPDNVPKKIDLLPILMDLLTDERLDTTVYQKLMSWECIAGVFTYTFSLSHYCPTLVIADQQHCQDPTKRKNEAWDMYSNSSKKRNEIWNIYSKGLRRAKMFLKRKDPILPERLLTIIESTISEEKELLDASVKLDLQLNPTYQDSLEIGLLKWMNELICDYIGFSEEEDEDLLTDGTGYISSSDSTEAEQWFDTGANIQTYVSFIIDRLIKTSKSNEKYSLLCNMTRNIKIANQKAFEIKLKNLDKDQIAIVENALIVDPDALFMNEDDLMDFSVPSKVENPQVQTVSPVQEIPQTPETPQVQEIPLIQEKCCSSRKRKLDSMEDFPNKKISSIIKSS